MHQSRIAVLIDGDNAYLGYLERVMAEAGQHGVVMSRRIYGGSVVLDSWLECIRRHGFEPKYAEGPDAADNALANDAMEMLRSGRVNRFYIVASDNGFAKLARQIREEGAFVVGIGASDKELSPFKDECDAFTRFENLPPPNDPDPAIREFVHTWEEGRQGCRPRMPRGKMAGPRWLTSGTASTDSILIFTVAIVMLSRYPL